MKKTATILAIATAILSQVTLQAEEGKGGAAGKGPEGKGGPDKRFDRLQSMKENLNLTDEQTQKLKAIFDGEKDRYMAIKEDKALSDEQKREKMRDFGKESMAQMSAILTPEQQEKMKEHMQKRMEGGQAGPGGQGGMEERLKGMKEHLNLTDDQVKKVKEAFEAEKEKLKALYEDKTLSEEQKREKMREMFKSKDEGLKGILTPEQQEKMKEQLKKRMEGRGPGGAEGKGERPKGKI